MTLSITSLLILFVGLLLLIVISAFFSGSEIGMMSLNRYRLRHMARHKNRAAQRAQILLQRPDRLLGVILIGNTFANILASSIATVLAVHFWGDIGVAIATIVLTLVILIFAEITPKTVAALYPERFAFVVSWPLKYLLRLFYPFVWLVNKITSALLGFVGVNVEGRRSDALTNEELRTVVREASGRMPSLHQDMLLRVLDMENVCVDDIMVPRNEMVGIDLDDSWDNILQQIIDVKHTRLPVYRQSIDKVQGVLDVRRALSLLAQGKLDKADLAQFTRAPYFVPEGTPLHTQLMNFDRVKRRTALVVDEYGDILGLVTLQDVVEEVVGEFVRDIEPGFGEVRQQKDGSYVVQGSINVRELNRLMKWQLPETGPKTLSGLIIEHLQSIPNHGVGLRLNGYPIEVLTVKGNKVKTARVMPGLRK